MLTALRADHEIGGVMPPIVKLAMKTTPKCARSMPTPG